jgi:hypothetical protein
LSVFFVLMDILYFAVRYKSTYYGSKRRFLCVFMGVETRCGSNQSDAWLRGYSCASERNRAVCDEVVVAQLVKKLSHFCGSVLHVTDP